MFRLLAAALLLSAVPAAAESLLVFAAVSTSEPLKAAAREFREGTGTRVDFSFGASSDLARQIRAGAPAQLFLSADEAQVTSLIDAGRTARPFLSNRLVVVVPSSSKRSVRSLAELIECQSIALADPRAVPAGVYARKWLERQGVWKRVEKKVIPTLDVRAALAAVEAGHAEAAIVYRTDAVFAKRARVAFDVPADQHPRIVYPLVTLAGADARAKAFSDFLFSAAGRAHFERAGFTILEHEER